MDNLSGTIVQTSKDGVITVELNSKDALYDSQMPFIKGLGLFIATKKTYQLGENVSIQLQLMEEAELFPVTGKVVWITPTGAQSAMTAGIGVQIQGETGSLNKKIATYLAGFINSERPTDTM